MSTNAPNKTRPSVFISHKHADSKIADEFSRFINLYTGKRAKVFQSSSNWQDAPQVGRNLTKELRMALWKTDILLLIYTDPRHDWDWCMWECGVASHPDSPDTKIILIQCGPETPKLFNDQVHVNARNLVDIQKFVNEFLTAPDFFPALGDSITDFHANGPEVTEAAAQLFQKIQPYFPGVEEPTEEWPAFPFLRLELNMSHVRQIEDAGPKERLRVTTDLLLKECLVVEGDRVAGQMFGAPGFQTDTKLGKLVSRWQERRPDSQSKWFESLCAQVMDGAQWNFPRLRWDLMQGLDNDNWYAPILNRVRRIPARGCMQFDIYFYKFEVKDGGDSALIPVPDKQP